MEGFSMASMSGVGWYGDLGNFLVMPTKGTLITFGGRIDHPDEGWRSSFRKRSEKASAGYYSVVLDRYKIKAEMTATPHAGFLRFTYPAGSDSRIQIDLARRIGGTSVLQYIKVVSKNAIEGWMKCTAEGGGWGNGKGKADYTMYFYAEFSRPLRDCGTWSAEIPEGWSRRRDDIISDTYIRQVEHAKIEKGLTEKQGKHLGFYTRFSTKKTNRYF
jgi:putative alpha-1,2-mannosidase